MLACAGTYTQGQDVNLRLRLTANHGGRHAFRVCASTTPTESCFGNNWLVASSRTAQPATGPRPGKRYWYIRHVTANPYRDEDYSGWFTLPAGISCPNGCVIQVGCEGAALWLLGAGCTCRRVEEGQRR